MNKRLRRSQRESYVNELMKQGIKMTQTGRFEQALQFYQKALPIARELFTSSPEDHKITQFLASLLYNTGCSLLANDQPEEAIEAFEESEQKYRALAAAEIKTVDPLLANVLAHKGLAKFACGYGASAVLDLEAAVSGYLSLRIERENDPHDLDFARVLSMNALVLQEYGDPDQAVLSANYALILYTSKSDEVMGSPNPSNHVKNYLVAAGVASEIHAAHDRMIYALSADVLAIHGARYLSKRFGSEIWRLAQALTRKGLHLKDHKGGEEAEALIQEGWSLDASAAQCAVSQWEDVKSGVSPSKLTVASSLGAAAKELGSDKIPDEAITLLTIPPNGVKVLIPSRRCHPRDFHLFARLLAQIALVILPLMKPEGLRLGLEAHYLFANALQTQTHEITDFAPSWMRILLACSRVYENAGELPMGLDLAEWGGRLAKQLTPFSSNNPELRALIVECLAQHGRMVILSGDLGAGEEILDLARNLSDALASYISKEKD